MAKQNTEPNAQAKTLVIHILKSGIFGLIITLLLVLLSALLLSIGLLPQGAVSTVAVCSCLLGGLLTGLRAVKGQSGGRLWLSAAAALALFFMLYLLGAVLFTRLSPAQNSLPILLAVLGGGIAGGVLSTVKPNKRKLHKKR